MDKNFYAENHNVEMFRHVYDTVPFFSRDNVEFLFKFVELKGAYYYSEAMYDFCKNKEAAAYPFFEPENPNDANAIVLRLADGRTLGYVPREIAAEIATIDTTNLFIRPRIKEFLSGDDYVGDKACFKFDIVRVKKTDLLHESELKTLTPIVRPPDNPTTFDHHIILILLATAIITALTVFACFY